MFEAYQREIEVMPVFEAMSKRGLRIALPRLKRDVMKWGKMHEEVGADIRKRLRCKELDINSSPQLAKALDKSGKMEFWTMTKPTKTFPHGQKSTKRVNLIAGCKDKKLVANLSLYGVLGTYISTFGEAWIQKAEDSGGYLYPNFNQVRSPAEYGTGMRGGTRTGRPSCSNPNLFNVPRNPYDEDKPWTEVLPKIRSYIIPNEGRVFLNRDYSQQEIRILAHFEEGLLYQAYLDDPHMDAHDYVQGMIYEVTGIKFPRKYIKVLNFGIIYGMGIPALTAAIGCEEDEAKELKKSHQKAFPSVKQLGKDITKLSKSGKPIVTWGGREYYVEEPSIIGGRKRTFEYKLLNYLIQGSAADCTKEAMIRTAGAVKGDLVLQVYDELMVESDIAHYKKDMALMKEAMESIEFDIPMLTEGKWSKKSWGDIKDYKDAA